MKWSFTSVAIIVAGLIGISIILLFEQITTSNESDYYLLKEVTEAAMIDSIDLSYYRETGDLKIVREKFVENFTRRFSESTLLTGTGYKINFYNIMETPPKVSITINTGIGEYNIYGNADDYNIANKLDAILEYTGENTFVNSSSEFYNNPYSKKETDKIIYYSLPSKKENENSIGVLATAIKMPSYLNQNNIKNVKIVEIKYEGFITDQSELGIALLKRELDYEIDNGTDYNLQADNLIDNLDVNEITYQNCNDSNSSKINGSDCSKYPYWISWHGTTTSGKTVAAVKLKITWSYEEYAY